jgi:hypothetical protein
MKSFTALTRKKMSLSAKARCTSQWRRFQSETKRTQINDDKLRSLYLGGMTQEEVAKAMGLTRKVIFNAMRRLKIQSRRAAKRDQWGDRNANWKGADASISKKHRRLDRRFGIAKKCSFCGTNDPRKTYDWANMSGDYDNPDDFVRLCRSCHWKLDGKFKNFKGSTGAARIGELHPNAKMSNSDIFAIRTSSESQRILARRFNCSQSNISNIRNGRTWVHVP